MSVRTYDPRMGHHTVRRVVTGIDANGDHVITSDGPAPNSIDAGPIGVSEVYWSAGPDRRFGDDPDRTGEGFPLEPPPGGVSGRVIRMSGIPPGVDPDDTWLRVDGDDPAVPGMHATDTLDLMVVLDGSVVMGLDDGERVIGPGEYVVQRGTRHRWRPADAHGWTYFVDIDIVLSGRVLLELPTGSTELGPGDVIVQRGTDHRWTALGDETFRMASVMISARP